MVQYSAAAVVLGSLLGTATASEHDVWGTWLTPDRTCLVRIQDCGDGTPCGIITWIDEGEGMVLDAHNPDPALAGRPMIGVTLLHGFERSDSRWGSGSIYNPEDGRTYRARLSRHTENTLAVSGCLGPICKKLLWERADESLLPTAEAASPNGAEVASFN